MSELTPIKDESTEVGSNNKKNGKIQKRRGVRAV